MAHCRWWIRWLHRKRRWIDREFVLDSLMQAALDRHPPMLAVSKALDAWELHKSLPGQEHWHCACAATEHDDGRK